MLTSSLALVATLLQGPVAPTLSRSGNAFVVSDGAQKISVPLERTGPKPATAVVFRKGDTFAVWDVDRGLSIRIGKQITSTWLSELPVSPRLFKEKDAQDNGEKIAQGSLKASAAALAGSARLGDATYFLVQWRDKAGEPWLEALIKVDLGDKKPIPELVGRFDGFSVARTPIGDELATHGDDLMIVARQGDTWGIARFHRRKRAFAFQVQGARLARSTNIAARTVVVEESMAYGSTLLARVYLPNGTRRNLLEVRGSIRLVDSLEPVLAQVTDNAGMALINLDTGAGMRLPGQSRIERTALGVIVAAPVDKPTSALLYDATRWDRLSLWSSGPQVSGGGL